MAALPDAARQPAERGEGEVPAQARRREKRREVMCREFLAARQAQGLSGRFTARLQLVIAEPKAIRRSGSAVGGARGEPGVPSHASYPKGRAGGSQPGSRPWSWGFVATRQTQRAEREVPSQARGRDRENERDQGG